ncbi:MAG: DUF4097 family beta strand repeat protein [Clostridia bacterium]|nr:DUF4097 family beta strand repeat protein [Clostridia bacterium]
MNQTKKILITVAFACIVLGITILFVAAGRIGFDFYELNGLESQSQTHTVTEEFKSLDIDTVEADVLILRAEDGVCRVVCEESDKVYHTVSVIDGTLSVKRVDLRKWYEHIGFFWCKMSVTVYLPHDSYDALDLESVSGNITVQNEFSFSNGEISSTSGNIFYTGAVENQIALHSVSGDIEARILTANNAECKATSGDIKIDTATLTGKLFVKTVSGEIEVREGNADRIEISSTSGNVALDKVQAVSHLQLDTTSGEITFCDADAKTVWIKSVSGNIDGSFLTPKSFVVDTLSGSVSVPQSVADAGLCELYTTSGNIRVVTESHGGDD